MNSNQKREVNNIEDTRFLLKTGFKYLAISLPLLFISPVLITIGFKAIKKSNSYFMIIFGCFLAIFTIVLVIQAFRKILKYLLSR